MFGVRCPLKSQISNFQLPAPSPCALSQFLPEYPLYPIRPITSIPTEIGPIRRVARRYKQAIDAVMNRAAAGEPVHATCTNKKEMENYLHIDAVNEALLAAGLPTPRNTNYADTEDVPRMLTGELNAVLPIHGQWKESVTKAFLNNHAVTKMNRARLTAIDPPGEIPSWFSRIEQMLQ